MEPNNLNPYNIHDTSSALIFLFAGVVTALLTLGLSEIWKSAAKKLKAASRFRHLCLELHYNIQTIQENLDNLHALEKHVIADTIDGYITRFEFHKVITVVLNEMYLDKTFYKELTLKELQGVQVFASLFNAVTNLDISQKIEIYRQSYKINPAQKPLMLSAIGVWRTQLQESKVALQNVFNKLAIKYNYRIKD